MKLYRKRGKDCSQKATSIPLYLKSNVQKQGEEDEGYEHYLVFLQKREESRSFDVFLCFWGEKYGEKREMPKQLPKHLSFNLSCQEPFIGPGTLFWAQLMSAILSLCTFLVLTQDAHFEVFLYSDSGNLGVPRKLWMSSFQKTKEIKIPTVGSKVMTLGSVLMCFSRFSQYLNRFNSDFDP